MTYVIIGVVILVVLIAGFAMSREHKRKQAGTGPGPVAHGAYTPVPFEVDDLPASLRDVVLGAIPDSLKAQAAYMAIERHWESGGARTPATLLAYAYLQFVEACEIMVDDQLENSRKALALIKEARAAGAKETDGLRRFEAYCREVESDEGERKAGLEPHFDKDPKTMDKQTATNVAYELMERGGHEAAIPFFERVIELTPPPEDLHYRVNRATCLVEAGRIEEARTFYEKVVRERKAIGDPWVVENAYLFLTKQADDKDLPEVFEAASAWAKETDGIFPSIYPNQDELLERALKAGHGDIALRVAKIIEETRAGRIPKDVQAQIDEARRKYGG